MEAEEISRSLDTWTRIAAGEATMPALRERPRLMTAATVADPQTRLELSDRPRLTTEDMEALPACMLALKERPLLADPEIVAAPACIDTGPRLSDAAAAAERTATPAHVVRAGLVTKSTV